jgi:hypothetical protein
VIGKGVRRTFLAEICDTGRTTWILGSGANTVKAASEIAGVEIQTTVRTDEDSEWRALDGSESMENFRKKLEIQDDTLDTDWIIIMRAHEATRDRSRYTNIVRQAVKRKARGIIMIWASGQQVEEEITGWRNTMEEVLNNRQGER